MRLCSLSLLAATLWSAGCATVGNFQRAETLGKGGWEVGIESSAYTLSNPDGSLVVPMLAVSVRAGATPRLDLGGRIGSGGAEIQGKVQLTKPRGEGPVIVSLAPSVGGSGFGFAGNSVGIVYEQLPVLIGVPLGDHELTFSPKVWVGSAFTGGEELSGTATRLSPGGGVGFAWRATRKLTLVPEISVLAPGKVFGSQSVAEEVDIMDNKLIYQGGLGFLLGRKR